MFKKLLNRVAEELELISDMFCAECYAHEFAGEPRRFPSLISTAFRWVLKYILFAVPVIWLAVLIGCIVEKLPVLGVILVSIIATVLVLVVIALVFFILMAFESFAKQLSSLILYGTPAKGAENLIDLFITRLFTGGQ